MDPTETIDMLEKSLARQLAWIAAAEKKASFVFALNTAMLGVLAAVAPDRIFDWESAPGFFASVAVFLSLLSLLVVVSSSFPKTTGPDGSLIFFGGISKLDLSEYTATVDALSEQDYIVDLSNQSHRNAEIATSKYSRVQKASWFLYVAVPFWLLALLFQYSVTSNPCVAN